MFNLPGFSSLSGISPNMMLPGLGDPSGLPGLQHPRTVEATKASRHSHHTNQAKKRERQERCVEEEREDAPPISDSPAVLNLIDEQRRVEHHVSHRRLEILDSLKSVDRHKRKIRVTVTNTHANQQPPQAYESVSASPSEPPSWTLAIHGRILEASDPTGAFVPAPGATPPLFPTMTPQGHMVMMPSTSISSESRGHFSDYLRRIEVQLDPALYPGEECKVVWEKSMHGSLPKDVFEVKRAGSQPTTAKVTIWVDWRPERFKLPFALAVAIGKHYDTRPRIYEAMSRYVAKNHLRDPANSEWVRLPISLAQLLAPEELQQQQPQPQFHSPATITKPILTYAMMMERVSQKLETMPPLELTHDIQVSGPPRAACAIDVDLDFGVALLGSPFQDGQDKKAGGAQFKAGALSPPSLEKALLQLEAVGQQDEAVAAELSKAERLFHEAKRRRTALSGFVKAPVDFVNGLAAAQAKELRVSKGQQQATAYTIDMIRQQRLPGFSPQFELAYHKHASLYATEFECKRRSAIFKEPWVEDVVLADRVYLSNKAQRSQPHMPMGPPPM